MLGISIIAIKDVIILDLLQHINNDTINFLYINCHCHNQSIFLNYHNFHKYILYFLLLLVKEFIYLDHLKQFEKY